MNIYTPTDDEIRITRALIPDKEAVYDGNTLFDDDDITDYLIAGNGSVLRAAGYANYAIATSEALISKVIKTQDLSTNGAAVSDSLVKKGNALFARADKDDANAAIDFFEIVDQRHNRIPELTEPDYPFGR